MMVTAIAKGITAQRLHILFYLLIRSLLVACLPPYFFLCNYQGTLEPLPQESDRLLLSVTLDENPKAYSPRETYTVRISSSEKFNGLLVTGLYSSSRVKENIHPLSYGMTSLGFGQDNPVQSDFICGLLHSDISPHKPPTTGAEFSWTAPSEGTGCVSFMATASLGMQIIFQDVVAYQICEAGQAQVNSGPSLADIHSDGVILRDDFDSEESANVWPLESVGVLFNDDCGEITRGRAAVFCGEFPARQLVTPTLNLSSASSIQFSSGTGSCSFVDVTMSMSYRREAGWVTFRQIRVTQQSQVSVVHLPEEARAENVSLKFFQDSTGLSNSGCWAMDNVLITDTENRPTFFYEDMDPIDASKWLFMPGADFEGDCMSHVNALVFSSSTNQTGSNYAVTRDLNLSGGSMQGMPPVDVEAIGGKFQSSACGHSNNTSIFMFNERGRREFCTTEADSLRNIAAVRFVLSMGSGDCHFGSAEAKISLVGFSEFGRQEIASFDHDFHKTPRHVTIPLPYRVQHAADILCLVQAGNDLRAQENVWAIDSFEFLPAPARLHHFVQFSICTQCSPSATETRIRAEYSNDFGRSWHLLQEPCFPETCTGAHWPYHSVVDGLRGWTRVNLRLPPAALTDHSRFRWIQDGDEDLDSRWAIDDIYIGTDEMCPGMCNGHGICFPDGCRCDVGWLGFFCNVSAHLLPSSLSVDFNKIQEIHSSFSTILGAHAGYDCGMLGTGKSLVFKDAGVRMLLTEPHNGTQVKYLQFAILMGRHSTVGTCQAPSSPGDGVLVHFTVNNAVTWKLLTVVPFDSDRRVIVVSVPLPSDAQVPGLQIRWLQPETHDRGKAVWAMDDIILSSDLYKSIYSTPENFQKIYTASVSFHTGLLTNYCNKTNVLLFSPQYAQYLDTLRYAETQTMETSEGYVLEADLNLQCDEASGPGITHEYDEDHELLLQYSKDEGVTWHLVQEENLPGSPDDESFHPASVYHVSEYSVWTTTVLPMPRNTWSSHLRLRVVHNENSQSVWALDNVYMGPACPMHCRNRGRCRNGVCQCNPDSIGPSCLSRTQLATGVDESFSDVTILKKKGWKVTGASVASKRKDACGAMPSDRYLLFNKPGVRKLSTPDIDTSLGGQIQFYIRISGGCKVPTERASGVLLQYSNNGGITWTLLNELYYTDYVRPQYVHRAIPTDARTKQTRFRWWQPRNGGADHEPWSIGDVIVGEPMYLTEDATGETTLKMHGRRSASEFLNATPKTFILLANGGQSREFCDYRSGSYVFNEVNGDRFATTDDLILKAGDTIQFEINIGCSESFSWDYPVHLEFSHDEGYSWDLVVRSCYPDGRPSSQMPSGNPDENQSVHDCTGAARQLTESSVYHRGDYGRWRRVVVPVSRRVAAMPVRLRWWQDVTTGSGISAPATWAISSVYIGPSCASHCSGHGRCALGLDTETCLCDEGYSGDHCQVAAHPIAGFWDHVSERPNPEWWNEVLGGSDAVGCGEVHEGGAFYFGREGTRKAETVSLDVVGVRMIQFFLKIGSSEDSDTCMAPEQRDEAVLLQYSNNNGITWNLIKELSFDAYNHQGERVIVDIPFPAKSPLTSFRWWQPLGEKGEHRSQWALDDVFIGSPDLLSDGFADDFDGESTLSEANWYRVRGGGVGNFTQCDGANEENRTALVFTSSGGVAETWDFRLNSGSFVQFDIAIGCESENPGAAVITLEYSTDSGQSWRPTVPSCLPGSLGCEHDFGSFFYAGLHQRWTRRTILLPDRITRSQIRFRWTKTYPSKWSSSWAIDNLYIGNGCPWMCSGHGRCWPTEDDDTIDVCICDQGFERHPHCQASKELNISLMDTFDTPWINEGKYLKMIGHDTNDESSVMINNENLRMNSMGIRMLETIPLNTVDTKYMQFFLEYKGIGVNTSSALVLQSSRNGGVTWSTIRLLFPSNSENVSILVHAALPEFARHDAVSFRIWQSSVGTAPPVFGAGEAAWALENLLIGGRVSGCDGHVIEDDFSFALDRTDSWLHHTHLSTAAFCNSTDALVVGRTIGEHSITTRDICVSEHYALQFKIAVGCSARPSDDHGVRLEYSTNHGVTWSLVREDYKSCAHKPGGCTDKLHPATIYYPGASSGWRRIIIPLSGHKCGSLRFRWYQGFYVDEFEAARAVPWAVDDVYVGPQCDQMCNGHGTCSKEGLTCSCDDGYGGDTCCDIERSNPTFFEETFDNEDGAGEDRAMEQWSTLSGGIFHKDTTDCSNGQDQYQWSYKVGEPGERILDTRDLDLRDADSVQFYIAYHHETHPGKINGETAANSDHHAVTEFVFVQYSTDGGILWNLLEVLPILNSKVDELQYIALSLPEQSRTNATRMRWWQPKSGNHFGFTIDQVVIGGPSKSLDEHFDGKTSYWTEMSGAEVQPAVGSKCCDEASSSSGGVCDILEVGGETDRRDCRSNFASTNGVKVTRGSYISFSLGMNCQAPAGHCEGIELQFSVDLGKSWQILVPPCYPSNAACTNFYQGSTFYSDVYPHNGENKRTIVPMPERAWSPSTRFRWLQTASPPEAWYIDDVYIGNECPGACLGHGDCHDGKCICDEGWSGFICQTATENPPSELKDAFAIDAVNSSMFSRIVGGEVDDVCGEVGFDRALHFYKPCSRLLETVALNTTKADFVQFMFLSGCGTSPPSERDEGVLVDYTVNGGAVWHNLAELYFDKHNDKPSFVNVLLPESAKATGTKFRWWQPRHSGLNQSDWALDNLLIGGKREEMMLSDDFNVEQDMGPTGLQLDRGENEMWQFYDNTRPDSFCGRDNILLAGKVPGLDVVVTTKDFIPEEEFMMQYTIVVLCQDVQRSHQPVHVQYSTDFGDTWQYLVPQCVPSDRNCFGKEITQPSAHFISQDWRRKTIWIPSFLHGQPVRFRFFQEESDVMWALDRVFIGPACPEACSGHGDCVGVPQGDIFSTGEVRYDARTCLCDFGYVGPNCDLDFDRNQKYLKDDFNAGENIGSWLIIEPRNTDERCGVLVDGHSMAFSGVGPRQAETEDLDLRDARFAQHNAAIGGVGADCLPAKQRNDGLLLQYSIDGGITWNMLHELDYISYQNSSHDYISLPLHARTKATRLRWWQPFEIDEMTGRAGMGEDRAGWALDNIYIGGQEVNAYALEDNFEVGINRTGSPGSFDEQLYEFYPNGALGTNQCPGEATAHMMWPGASDLYPKQSLTTRQLIVQSGHMIQFKIKVGCTEDTTCSSHFLVKLEYREDPRYDDSWQLVKPECYPGSPPSHLCHPYEFHAPSAYKLEYQNVWTRITIPLDYISSDTAQFRWMQDDHAPELYSWAIDEVYIGEMCPNYCSGHGKCTRSLECICDKGFAGNDCSQPISRYVIPDFRETFELPSINERLWSNLSGGRITSEGCGPLRPYGFSRSVYFDDCGRRQLVTREMDLTKAWQIQYVLQFGSKLPNKDCRIYQGDLYDGTITSTIIFQYTTDGGTTWHTLRVLWPSQYGVARRVTQRLPFSAKTKATMLRWWQPNHHGEGYDQWALDNVDIIRTRRQRHFHFLDFQAQLGRHSRLQSREREPPVWNSHSRTENLRNNAVKMPSIAPVEERAPPDNGLVWN